MIEVICEGFDLVWKFFGVMFIMIVLDNMKTDGHDRRRLIIKNDYMKCVVRMITGV